MIRFFRIARFFRFARPPQPRDAVDTATLSCPLSPVPFLASLASWRFKKIIENGIEDEDERELPNHKSKNKILGVPVALSLSSSARARSRGRKRVQVRALKTACARSAPRGVAERAVLYQHQACVCLLPLPTATPLSPAPSTRRGRRVYQASLPTATAYCYSLSPVPCLLPPVPRPLSPARGGSRTAGGRARAAAAWGADTGSPAGGSRHTGPP